MKGNKLILDTVFEDEFKLIAIHCSLEPYRIAYFVNKQLKLKLGNLVQKTFVIMDLRLLVNLFLT